MHTALDVLIFLFAPSCHLDRWGWGLIMQRSRPLRRLLVLAEVVCGVLSVIGADDLERSCEVEAYYDARQDLSSLAGHELQTLCTSL